MKVPLVLASIHALAIFLVALSVLNSGELEIWFLFILYDFPVSLGVLPLNEIIDLAPLGPLADANGNRILVNDTKNFWLPLLYFGVIGTIWWFIAPFLVIKLFRKIRKINI